jgi:hypothetical protein
MLQKVKQTENKLNERDRDPESDRKIYETTKKMNKTNKISFISFLGTLEQT